MQRVKLIFACKHANSDPKSDLKFKVSVKNDWVYNLEKAPESSIGYTLRKFKIAKDESEELELAKKYRAYRIREDPKTRYRYVTEILNMEEARELVNKKWSMILVCQKSIIKDPSEDFKVILDEGERKMLQKFDDEGEEAKGSDEEDQAKEQSKNSSSSDEPSQKSAEKKKAPARKNIAQKRVQGEKKDANSQDKVANSALVESFQKKFPQAVICGKENEYYKIQEPLDFIKETQQTTYSTKGEFEKDMLRKLNKIHHTSVKDGTKSDEFRELYHFTCTPKYLQLKCKMPKCKFMCWYNFDKEEGSDPKAPVTEPRNIKFFRSINMSHEMGVCGKVMVE